MNISIGSLVGEGNTADVFDIDNNRVIKLFHTGYPRSSVEKEYTNSKLLNQLNIPIPKSYEIITYHDRFGIVYDKINGISLQDILIQSLDVGKNIIGDVEKCITILASMHKIILCQKALSATSCKTTLQENIQCTDALSKQSKTRLLQMLNDLPDGDSLCHGDFHFGNILMTQQGCYVIDFMNICKGHKYFDIARTLYLTEFTPIPDHMPNKEKVLKIKKKGSDLYLREMGINRALLSDWLTVIVAARLSELSKDQILEKNTIMQYLETQGLGI